MQQQLFVISLHFAYTNQIRSFLASQTAAAYAESLSLGTDDTLRAS